MKFTANRESLLRILGVAQDIISEKSPLSVLSNVYLKTDKANNKVVVKCSNLKVEATTSFPAEIEEEGETTAYCEKLVRIISALPNGDVKFSGGDSELTIKPESKKASFKVNCLSTDKFPEIRGFDDNGAFKFPAKEFKEMVKSTIFAVSNDINRYFMSGVFFTKHEGKPIMVATDGRRMSFRFENIEVPDFAPAIIPTQILNLISKVCPSEGDITINIKDKIFCFKGHGFEFISTLIDAQYPNWQRVIPQGLDHTISVAKTEFVEAIKRVGVMLSKKSTIQFVVEPGKMTVVVPKTEIGQADEEISANYNGEKVEITVNSEYLNDVLTDINGDTVSMEFKLNQENKVSAAIVIKDNDTAKVNCTHLVMPMQI